MKNFIFLLCCTAFLVTGIFFGRGCSTPAPEPATQIDTLYIVDTLRIEKPVYITSVVTKVDTLVLHTTDSVLVEVPIPIESRTYADSTYRAQVSGYNPTLDWIEVFPKTTIITKTTTIPAKKFGFDITVGPSIVFNGGIHGGIGATAGVSYRF